MGWPAGFIYLFIYLFIHRLSQPPFRQLCSVPAIYIRSHPLLTDIKLTDIKPSVVRTVTSVAPADYFYTNSLSSCSISMSCQALSGPPLLLYKKITRLRFML
jgi:hypothetical protein